MVLNFIVSQDIALQINKNQNNAAIFSTSLYLIKFNLFIMLIAYKNNSLKMR